MRKLRADFGGKEASSAPYVRYLAEKAKDTGILINEPKRQKPKTVLTTENIAAVAESAININSPSFSTIELSGDIIERNYA